MVWFKDIVRRTDPLERRLEENERHHLRIMENLLDRVIRSERRLDVLERGMISVGSSVQDIKGFLNGGGSSPATVGLDAWKKSGKDQLLKGDGPQDPCRGMKIIEASEYVLRERGERMTPWEIAARALELGWKSKAKDPADTLRATLYREVKRPECPVYRDGAGLFNLRDN